MNDWTDENWSSRFDIVYKCELSALYHRKRERFFSLLDKLATSITLILGASAMTDLLPEPQWKAIAGALVVVVTLPGIVFSWSDKARTHALLAAKFIALEAEIEGAGVLDATKLDALKAKALYLEMEEPPQLSVLTRICQNEMALATGNHQNVSTICFFEKMLAQWLDMPATNENRCTNKAANTAENKTVIEAVNTA